MKGLCTLLLETFVFVVQQQVDGGLAENEISQQLSNEDRRQNPPQTDSLRDEASTDSQQYCHLSFTDIHAALRELTATVTEQKVNIRALETQLKEQQTFILKELNKKNDALETRLSDAEKTAEQQTVILEELNKKTDVLETRLRDAEKTAEQTVILEEMNKKTDAIETQLREQQTVILEDLNKKTDEISNLTLSQVEKLRKENRDREIAFSAGLFYPVKGGYTGPFTTEITLTYKNVFTNIGNAYNPITGTFTAPLKGSYMFKVCLFDHGYSSPSSASIMKNGQPVVVAYGHQSQGCVNSSNGAVLILEVGDVVYVRLRSGSRIYDDNNNLNTFSGYLLFPLKSS